MERTIYLKNLLNSSQVALRTTTDLILQEILSQSDSKKQIIIDFTDINFISRSFTHQFITAIESLKTTYQISLKNMLPEVASMVLAIQEQKINQDFTKSRKNLFPNNFDSQNPVSFF